MSANFSANYATEQAFLHATLREFVKLWGNGSQAFLHVQCVGGQAWVQLTSALGHPSSPHLFRQDHHHHGEHGQDHHHHGYNGQYPRQYRRKKGPKQRERDRARAALHRASLVEATASAAPPAPFTAPAPETSNHQTQTCLHASPLHTSQEDFPEYVQSSGPLLGQVAHPQADHPHDLPPKAGLPADDDPHIAGHPADPFPPPGLHESTSYSTVAQFISKPPTRLPDTPGSPGGWGAVDPIRGEDCDRDSDDHVSPLPLLPSYPLPSELPAEEEIAAMTYEELIRFAEGGGCS